MISFYEYMVPRQISPLLNQGAARCHWHGHSPPQRKAAADSRHGYVTSRTPWDPSRVVQKMPIVPHENGKIQTKSTSSSDSRILGDITSLKS